MSNARKRLREITEEWIKAVEDEIATPTFDVEITSKRALSRKVKCSSPALTYILSGDQANSHLVEPISLALGLSLPPLVQLTEEEQDLVSTFNSLDKAGKEAIIATLAALSSKRQNDS